MTRSISALVKVGTFLECLQIANQHAHWINRYMIRSSIYYCRTLCVLFWGISAIFDTPANAQWLNRTVQSVNGTFTDLSPQFGFEVGLGTSHIEWGVALPGSFTSTLEFNGYDAWPGFDQEWYWPGGQFVVPGQSFLAGSITFRNGSVAPASSSPDLTVEFNPRVFGSEFQIDGHPLLVSDTLNMQIRETPNSGVDPIADADFVYFPDFPSLGSIRVYEGASTTFRIYSEFGGPLAPTAFGPAENSNSGFLSQSITDNPRGAAFETNLIVNPGAEAGIASADGNSVVPIPSWSTVSNFTAVVYGAPDGFPTVADPGPLDRGRNFFAGGPTNASSSASQVVNVASNAAQIDAGQVTFDLSGYLGGFWEQNDNAVLSATFRSGSNVSLGSASIGPVTPADRMDLTGMLFRSTSGAVPIGTRTIDVKLLMTRLDFNFNDGYADNLSLVLHAVPEPSGFLLLGLGTAVVGTLCRSRSKQSNRENLAPNV